MKHKHHIINTFILLMSLVNYSCKDNQHELSRYKWPILNQEFDDCVDRLEDAYYGDSSLAVIDTLTNSLVYYARAAKVGESEKKQLNNRLLFWKGRAAALHNSSTDERECIMSALKSTDSSNFAYDFNRFRLRALKINPDTYRYGNSLVTLTSSEDFFKNYDDSASLAHVYVMLSNIYRVWQYNAEAKDYLRKAARLYTVLHKDVYTTKIKLNLANILSQTDSTETAVRILDSLRNNPVAISSPSFYNMVLRNLFILTGHVPYLKEAYRMISEKDGFESDKTLYLYNLINISLNENMPDSAMYYIAKGLPVLEGCTDLEHKSNFLFAAAQTYENLGNTEKAYDLFKQATETYARSNDKNRTVLQTLAEQNKTNAIEQGRNEIDRIKYINRTRLIIILLSVLLCIAVAYLIIRIRLQRQRETQKQLEYERDSNKLKLESVALVAQEKENVINGIGKMIETLRKSNSISNDSAREISNAIKIHLKSEDDRTLFQNLHDLIKPEFSSRLRQEFPSLSDSNIRFLSYIVIGLSNKEIARIMMINHQSVNNNRHRLKKKLGLSPDESLDDFLRKYN